jgi:hypothetical protein
MNGLALRPPQVRSNPTGVLTAAALRSCSRVPATFIYAAYRQRQKLKGAASLKGPRFGFPTKRTRAQEGARARLARSGLGGKDERAKQATRPRPGCPPSNKTAKTPRRPVQKG